LDIEFVLWAEPPRHLIEICLMRIVKGSMPERLAKQVMGSRVWVTLDNRK